MPKYLKIENCGECNKKSRVPFNNKTFICTLLTEKQRKSARAFSVGIDLDTIHPNCPLEDAKDGEE